MPIRFGCPQEIKKAAGNAANLGRYASNQGSRSVESITAPKTEARALFTKRQKKKRTKREKPPTADGRGESVVALCLLHPDFEPFVMLY